MRGPNKHIEIEIEKIIEFLQVLTTFALFKLPALLWETFIIMSSRCPYQGKNKVTSPFTSTPKKFEL